MELSERVNAIRASVTLTRLDHVVYLRIAGDGAYEAVDRIFPRELYLRDGQLSQGVLLDDDGRIFADCYLGSDEGEFFLLAEGPDPKSLLEYVGRHRDGLDDVVVESRALTHQLIGIDGPYAWELVARLVGPEVIGLPYLTFFHFDRLVCCRAGKTGEYGYALIVAREAIDDVWDRLLELGRPLDVAEGSLDALDACALENWFFNVRGEGKHAVTPLELQLQWRISRRKSYVGSEALRRMRETGVARRLTCLVADAPMHDLDAVVLYGETVGSVLHAGPSFLRGDWVGLALIDDNYAHPGVMGLRVGEASAEGRSVTPPVLNNRSLYVNPQVHSYASRLGDGFPPIVTP